MMSRIRVISKMMLMINCHWQMNVATAVTAIADFMSVEPLNVKDCHLLLDKADYKNKKDRSEVHYKDVCKGVVLLTRNVAELD